MEKTKPKKMIQPEIISKVGKALVERLTELTEDNESDIIFLCNDAMTYCINSNGNLSKPILTGIRKIVAENFPSITTENEHPKNYYRTNAGKGKTDRWEHLALFHLSEKWQDRAKLIGDEAKENYFNGLKPFDSETEQPIEQPIEQTTEQPTEQSTNIETKGKLEMLTLTDLNLSEKLQNDVAFVLENTGLNLHEYLTKALEIYTNTAKGKIDARSESLAHISTQELITNKKYSTHPQRPIELVRRTIEAIKKYNAEQPDPKDRWIITSNLLTTLTNVRQTTAKELLETVHKDDVESYHQNHPEFYKDGKLNPYHNRKEGQDAKLLINVALLVPDGI